MFSTEKNTLGNHHTQQPATTNSHDTKMSSLAASNPAAIYESDTLPQDPEVSDVTVNDDDDGTSNDDKDNGSGDEESEGEETEEDAAFHCAAWEIMNRTGQRVGTAVMDWGGGDGW